MGKYIVSFQWYDSDTYCTNFCIAKNAKEVEDHYAKKYGGFVTVREAKDFEYEMAKNRGMPINKISDHEIER